MATVVFDGVSGIHDNYGNVIEVLSMDCLMCEIFGDGKPLGHVFHTSRQATLETCNILMKQINRLCGVNCTEMKSTPKTMDDGTELAASFQKTRSP